MNNQHFILNGTALNSDAPSLIPGFATLHLAETSIYGQDGNDTPDYEAEVVTIPEYLTRQNPGLIWQCGWLQGQIDNLYSVEVIVQVVNHPDLKQYVLAAVPASAVGFVVDQIDTLEPTIYHTFEQALVGAYNLKKEERFNWIEISPVDKDGVNVGDGFIYYDGVK